VLTSSLQRLADTGGDPVIGLQTAFGGGKTHTMLAVYHLAKAADLKHLEGLGPIAEIAGVKAWKRPRVAVFVGSSKGTDVSLNLKDGPQVHTLWGYIAWRLAGDAGLKLVAQSEAARTNPGSEIMVEVLKLAGPSIILCRTPKLKSTAKPWRAPGRLCERGVMAYSREPRRVAFLRRPNSRRNPDPSSPRSNCPAPTQEPDWGLLAKFAGVSVIWRQ